VKKDLSRKYVMKLIVLICVIGLFSACDRILNPISAQITQINTPIPSSTNTPRPTLIQSPIPEHTQIETPTQTPTETPTPALVPTLGLLPTNSDQQLPFPGYTQENYTDGWNILRDSWNPLWTKWQRMAAGQLGPGGYLVVRPVEGEAGIVCEDAVDGSYKGMTLCPPLDVVNGGFLPFPGMDVAANTDYYPLFIQRSSQYARLKSVGTGTSLVLQEVDSAGKPTRYIKPKNDANGNGGVWVAGEYVAPIEYPATVTVLSPEQLAEKHLYGSGFEIKTEFQGIPVDLTIVTSNATLAQYNQTRGCMPNQEMVKYGASAEDRMAEMVFLGHYTGYLRDRGLTEGSYPFTQYVADLTAGKDRSYILWGVGLDQSIGEFRVNPLKTVEYVTTNAEVDPDGNGRGIGLHGDNISRFGYQQLENGGVRIVEAIRSDYKNYRAFCNGSCMALSASLIFLGVRLEFLKGDFPSIYAPDYPIAVARQWEIWFDDRIWKDSHGLLDPGVLVP
jgi:hypothetical protein